MSVKTTINSTNREVTFHLDQTEVTISYTTFRQLMMNGVIAPPAPPPVRPVPGNVVDPFSFKGSQLEEKFPGRGPFTSDYFPGSYYDQSSTTYYDRDRNVVEYECHGHYG